ncbi:MAG: hypothetical protein PHC64_01785 [Candidatus Gastranaerophilales bacterium]|nr:hypothetical protein [Candidatus Gastranaerophilales bacterium]
MKNEKWENNNKLQKAFDIDTPHLLSSPVGGEEEQLFLQYGWENGKCFSL